MLVSSEISKAFNGTQALNKVNFDLRPGEIHALVGENGAGKSTLIKILAGVHQPDSGSIILDGNPIRFSDPLDARQKKISAIYQEPTLFFDLSIAENIFAGNLPTTRPLGRVDWDKTFKESDKWLAKLGIKRDTHTKVRGLPIADQQMVEIAKALALDARVLIMDEPTSALTLHEVDELFDIVRKLRDSGTAIIFITHRIEEVFQIADRVTVLRDGHFVGVHSIKDVNNAQIIKMMVGRTVDDLYPKVKTKIGNLVFRVEGFSKVGSFRDVSFKLFKGEILGFAGLAGSGRTDVVRAIFGIERPDSGSIYVNDKKVKINSPQEALALELAYLPSDRQHHGLVFPFNIINNITLPILEQYSRLGWLNPRAETKNAKIYAEKMDVRATGLWQEVRELSGGNQQKVVLAKWLSTRPQILILHEPTRGIDVGTKAAVHELMSQLASEGMAMLMISSELPEILGMSDRIIVMSEGKISAEFDRSEATQEKIMVAMEATQERIAL